MNKYLKTYSKYFHSPHHSVIGFTLAMSRPIEKQKFIKNYNLIQINQTTFLEFSKLFTPFSNQTLRIVILHSIFIFTLFGSSRPP